MMLVPALKRSHIFARCSTCLLVHGHRLSEQTSKVQAYHRWYDRKASHPSLPSVIYACLSTLWLGNHHWSIVSASKAPSRVIHSEATSFLGVFWSLVSVPFRCSSRCLSPIRQASSRWSLEQYCVLKSKNFSYLALLQGFLVYPKSSRVQLPIP